jgi:hypothetical protein
MANEDLIKRIEALERKLTYPIPLDMQKILEQIRFDELHIKTLRGGLPVFAGARTDTPAEGEIWIQGSSVKFRSGGTTYTLTEDT